MDIAKKIMNTAEKVFLQSSLQVSMARETLEGSLTSDMIEAEICRRLQDDIYDEYLVDGAVLTCTKAKWDDFELSDGDKVTLYGITEEKKMGKPTSELRVLENSLSKDGLCHGTVTDAVLNQNILPFQCNCRVPATIEQEQKIKANIKKCREAGVCKQLIDLEDKWENINFNVPYATFSDAKQSDSSAGDFIATSQITSTEAAEGIMMTSVLSCKHGGFIYPLTSGQKTSTLTIEEALDIMTQYLQGEGISEEELANAISWLAKNCGLTVNDMIYGDFSQGEAHDASQRFDNQIIAWTFYWNVKIENEFSIQFEIDPNVIKAMIAQESSFGRIIDEENDIDKNVTRNVMRSLATGDPTLWIASGINPYANGFEDGDAITFIRLDNSLGEGVLYRDKYIVEPDYDMEQKREEWHFQDCDIIKNIFKKEDGKLIYDFNNMTPDMSIVVGIGALAHGMEMGDGKTSAGLVDYNPNNYVEKINRHLENMGCEPVD